MSQGQSLGHVPSDKNGSRCPRSTIYWTTLPGRPAAACGALEATLGRAAAEGNRRARSSSAARRAFHFTPARGPRHTREPRRREARERLGALLVGLSPGAAADAEADWQVLARRCCVGRRHGRPAPRDTTGASDTCSRRARRCRSSSSGRDDAGRQGAEEPLRQVPPGQPVSRAGRRRRAVAPAEGTIRVVDFGCGKSYLTFAIHHLLTELRGRDVEIVGLDLKDDVIRRARARRALRSGGPPLRAGRDRRLRRGRRGRPRRQPPRLRHRDRRGARAGGPVAGRRDPGRALLPEGGLRADPELAARAVLRHGLAKERFAALVTDAPRPAARAPTATGHSWSSSSHSSTRRRTS